MRSLPIVAMLAVGCGSKTEPPPPSLGSAVGSGSATTTLAMPPAPPAFPEGTRSLELVRTVGVRL
ncbi:MAG TPA: hypothetical protein VF403_11075, partial [Kofleriaceae bacterium]